MATLTRVSAGLWHRCPECKILLQDARTLLTHRAKKHESKAFGSEGTNDVLESSLFHTSNGIWKIRDMPDSETPELFVPKIKLIPLDSFNLETLVEAFLPFICLQRTDMRNIDANFCDDQEPEVLSTETRQTRSGQVYIPNSSNRRRKSQCKYCKQFLNSHETVRKSHYQNCPAKPSFFCEECSSCLPTAATLAAHIELHHRRSKRYKCAICSNQFATLKGLKKHCKNTRCKHLVTKEMELQMASWSHVKTEPGVETVQEESLIKHNDSSQKSCPYCKRCILSTVLRQQHIEKCKQSSATTPTFPCLYSCPSKFQSAEDRAQHNRIFHQGQPEYACEFCNKPKATLEMLNRHLSRSCLRKVAQGKPIVKSISRYTGICPYCQAFFPKKHSLREHIRLFCLPKHKLSFRTSTAGTCSVCGKLFSSTKSLRQHVQRVCSKKYAEQGRSVCSCGVTFAYTSGLRRHLKYRCPLRKCQVKNKPLKQQEVEVNTPSSIFTSGGDEVAGCSRGRRTRRGISYTDADDINNYDGDNDDLDFIDTTVNECKVEPEMKHSPLPTSNLTT